MSGQRHVLVTLLRGRRPSTDCKIGWVGLGDRLDGYRKSYPHHSSNLESPSPFWQPNKALLSTVICRCHIQLGMKPFSLMNMQTAGWLLSPVCSAWASTIFPSDVLCGPFLQYVLPAWTYLDGRWNIPQRPYKHAHHTHFYQWGKHTEEQTNIRKCHRTNFREMVILSTEKGVHALNLMKQTSDIHLVYNTCNRSNGLIPSQA